MAPTRRPSKSKYTADRGIPGAFEGETVTRRRFMTGTVHGAGALMTMGFALPALAFAIGPIFENVVARLADRSARPTTSPTTTTSRRSSRSRPGIGEAGKSTVYIRARNPAIDTTPPNAVQPLGRDLHALRAPRLPGALGAGRRSASSAPATAASTTSRACASAARRRARSTASTRG